MTGWMKMRNRNIKTQDSTPWLFPWPNTRKDWFSNQTIKVYLKSAVDEKQSWQMSLNPLYKHHKLITAIMARMTLSGAFQFVHPKSIFNLWWPIRNLTSWTKLAQSSPAENSWLHVVWIKLNLCFQFVLLYGTCWWPRVASWDVMRSWKGPTLYAWKVHTLKFSGDQLCQSIGVSGLIFHLLTTRRLNSN